MMNRMTESIPLSLTLSMCVEHLDDGRGAHLTLLLNPILSGHGTPLLGECLEENPIGPAPQQQP